MSDPQITFDTGDLEFRVNQEKRTISGLLLPWDVATFDSQGISKWKFAKDSLYAKDVGRVKLNLHHDRKQSIGRAVRLQSTQAGLDGTFVIARGEEGDRALSLAEDGVLDGFSIEPHFADSDGWISDPDDRSVRKVTSARLASVALIPVPSYDDARVTSVTLQQEEGIKMADEKNAIESTEKVEEKKEEKDAEFSLKDAIGQMTEAHVELTKDLSKAIGESVAGAFQTTFENQDAERGTVKANRWMQVTDAPIYRFSGSGNSLLKDVWYATKEHDPEAAERYRRFQAQQHNTAKVAAERMNFANPQNTPMFDSQGQPMFADVDTTSAADVIPPGYRPDLFVPILAQGRPLADLASRGTLSDATPFVVPQFGTISVDLVGDHAEGSAPTEGTMTITSATVSPVAVSGKLPITREIIDSSSPGVDGIVLAALREDYARKTEAKVYTELNTNNTAGDTYAAATIVQDIRDEMDEYSFTRFASPTGGAVSQAASAAISADVDGSGRPFIPAVGAQNAFGQANATSGAWPIDGVGFGKAWAMTGTSGNAEVLIVNRADVYVWESPTLTFRFEEKQGPEIIEMALFGYFATKVLRVLGIRAMDAA
jgi:HK97 family phage prohead protease